MLVTNIMYSTRRGEGNIGWGWGERGGGGGRWRGGVKLFAMNLDDLDNDMTLS